MKISKFILALVVVSLIHGCKGPDPDWSEGIVGSYKGLVSGDSKFTASVLITKIDGKHVDVTVNDTQYSRVFNFRNLLLKTETSFSGEGYTTYWTGQNVTTAVEGSIGGKSASITLKSSSGGYFVTFVGSRP